jgi:hypothetical protein
MGFSSTLIYPISHAFHFSFAVFQPWCIILRGPVSRFFG